MSKIVGTKSQFRNRFSVKQSLYFTFTPRTSGCKTIFNFNIHKSWTHTSARLFTDLGTHMTLGLHYQVISFRRNMPLNINIVWDGCV